MAPATDPAPYLDVADPGFSFRSEEVASAAARSWYARTPYGLAVLRYAEVSALLKDRRLGQGSWRWPEHNGVSGPFADWWRRTLINLDGAEHIRQRRIYNPAFAPGVATRMAPAFNALAHELVDGFAGTGRCEFVAEFSQPFATRVVCKLLAVPESQWETLAAWTSAMGLALGVTFREDLPAIEDGLAHLTAFAQELIDERRRTPGDDDTVTRFLAAERSGELAGQELCEAVVNLFFGGIDTTRNQLGLALDLFLDHPDQWALLAERPDLAPAAVEEAMRHRPTTTWVTREALEDLVFNDVAIPRGTTVHLVAAVAATDPVAFGERPAFDITAERPPHFAFGGGLHHCLGHFVARRDMAEALAVLARRLPSIERDGPATWLPDSGNTGPTSLPIRFGAPA